MIVWDANEIEVTVGEIVVIVPWWVIHPEIQRLIERSFCLKSSFSHQSLSFSFYSPLLPSCPRPASLWQALLPSLSFLIRSFLLLQVKRKSPSGSFRIVEGDTFKSVSFAIAFSFALISDSAREALPVKWVCSELWIVLMICIFLIPF